MTDEGSQGKDRPRTASEKEDSQADRPQEPTSNPESPGPRAAELDDEVVAELRRSYNPPPKPPLDAIWEKIERGRADTSDDQSTEPDSVLSIVKPDEETVPRRRRVNGPAGSEEPPPREALKRIVDQ